MIDNASDNDTKACFKRFLEKSARDSSLGMINIRRHGSWEQCKINFKEEFRDKDTWFFWRDIQRRWWNPPKRWNKSFTALVEELERDGFLYHFNTKSYPRALFRQDFVEERHSEMRGLFPNESEGFWHEQTLSDLGLILSSEIGLIREKQGKIWRKRD